jgi:hypothetical protein
MPDAPMALSALVGWLLELIYFLNRGRANHKVIKEKTINNTTCSHMEAPKAVPIRAASEPTANHMDVRPRVTPSIIRKTIIAAVQKMVINYLLSQIKWVIKTESASFFCFDTKTGHESNYEVFYILSRLMPI